jgi:hypothetical protein
MPEFPSTVIEERVEPIPQEPRFAQLFACSDDQARRELRFYEIWSRKSNLNMYRRVKTGKTFYRPMNRVVHAHIKSIMPNTPRLNAPVFFGGGSRPNGRFRQLCALADIKSKTNVETDESKSWSGCPTASSQTSIIKRSSGTWRRSSSEQVYSRYRFR